MKLLLKLSIIVTTDPMAPDECRAVYLAIPHHRRYTQFVKLIKTLTPNEETQSTSKCTQVGHCGAVLESMSNNVGN